MREPAPVRVQMTDLQTSMLRVSDIHSIAKESVLPSYASAALNPARTQLRQP